MHLVGLALSLALAAPLPPPVPLAELVSRMAVAEGAGVDPDASPVVFVGVRYVGLAANAATTTPVTTVAAWENIDRANPNWRLAVLDEALSRRFEQDDLAVPPKAKATLSGGAISLEPQAPIDGRDLLVVADARVPFWKVQRVLYAAESLRRGPVLERRAGPTPCLPVTLLELPFGTAVEFGTTAVAGPTGACIAGDDHADVVRATLKAAGKKLCVGAMRRPGKGSPTTRACSRSMASRSSSCRRRTSDCPCRRERRRACPSPLPSRRAVRSEAWAGPGR
jgi:hypothetical protein